MPSVITAASMHHRPACPWVALVMEVEEPVRHGSLLDYPHRAASKTPSLAAHPHALPPPQRRRRTPHAADAHCRWSYHGRQRRGEMKLMGRLQNLLSTERAAQRVPNLLSGPSPKVVPSLRHSPLPPSIAPARAGAGAARAREV